MDLKEIDKLIAEKVMGGTLVKDCPPGVHIVGFPKISGVEILGTMLPRYSTDISAAWEVVEKLYEHEMVQVTCWTGHRNRFSCKVGQEQTEFAESIPLAICLAALKSLGINIPSNATK